MKRRSVSIPVAHLREDIREAKAMARELARGVARDERALKMAKRKKRLGSFSGSNAQHEESVRASLREVGESIHDANEHLKLADEHPAAACTSAFEALTDAWIGVSSIGSDVSWLPYEASEARRLRMEHSSLRSAAQKVHLKFRNACLRTRRNS